jgi:hypothetical protein
MKMNKNEKRKGGCGCAHPQKLEASDLTATQTEIATVALFPA